MPGSSGLAFLPLITLQNVYIYKYVERQTYGSHFPAIRMTSQPRSNCVRHEQCYEHIQRSLLNALFQSRKTLQHSSYICHLAAYCKVPSDFVVGPCHYLHSGSRLSCPQTIAFKFSCALCFTEVNFQ